MRVGQLVDDDEEVGVGREDALGPGQRRDLAGPDRLVELVDVLEAERREVVVAGVHLAHDPLQGLGGLLGVRDDRGDEVRDALVGGELDALGVDEDEAHLVGVARMRIEVIIELTKLDLPLPVAPATRRCGILARLAMT